MNHTIKNVLFDLDGTLLNTNDHIIKCFKHTFETVLNKNISIEEITHTFGIPLPIAMKSLGGKMAPKLLSTYMDYSEKLGDADIHLFPGTNHCLETCYNYNLQMAVVTSRRKEAALYFLEKFNISNYFKAVIGPEDTENKKPHPEPVLRAINMLEAAPQESVFIGDSAHDVTAAILANVKPIGVSYAAQGIQPMRHAGCDIFIDQLADLPEVIINKE